MPRPMTPAPMTATFGFAGLGEGRFGNRAAPFAGMTQTGSMGLISAASPRHPKPYSALMMGILQAMHKPAGMGPPAAQRQRASSPGIEQCRGSEGPLAIGSDAAAR